MAWLGQLKLVETIDRLIIHGQVFSTQHSLSLNNHEWVEIPHHCAKPIQYEKEDRLYHNPHIM